MKRIVNVLREDVANQIADECGCSYIINDLGETKVFSFVETDKLHKYIKSRFSKKEWFYGNKVFL